MTQTSFSTDSSEFIEVYVCLTVDDLPERVGETIVFPLFDLGCLFSSNYVVKLLSRLYEIFCEDCFVFARVAISLDSPLTISLVKSLTGFTSSDCSEN